MVDEARFGGDFILQDEDGTFTLGRDTPANARRKNATRRDEDDDSDTNRSDTFSAPHQLAKPPADSGGEPSDAGAVASVALDAAGAQTSSTAPVVVDAAPFSYVRTAGEISINLSDSFSDTDSEQTLTYSLKSYDIDGSRFTAATTIPVAAAGDTVAATAAALTQYHTDFTAATGLTFTDGVFTGMLGSKANYAITVTASDGTDSVDYTFALTATDFFDFSSDAAIFGSDDPTIGDKYLGGNNPANAADDNIIYLRRGEDSIDALSRIGEGHVDTIILRGMINMDGKFVFSDVSTNPDTRSNEVYGTGPSDDGTVSGTVSFRSFETGVDRIILVVTAINDGNDSTTDTDVILTDTHKQSVLKGFTVSFAVGVASPDQGIGLNERKNINFTSLTGSNIQLFHATSENKEFGVGSFGLNTEKKILDTFGVANLAIVHHSVFEAPSGKPILLNSEQLIYVETAGEEISIDFSDSFFDFDDDTLTYSITSFDGDGAFFVKNDDDFPTIDSDPAAALAEFIRVTGLQFDTSTGILSGRLKHDNVRGILTGDNINDAASGSHYVITVTASDGTNSIDHTFSLTSSNFYNLRHPRDTVNIVTSASDPVNATGDNIYFSHENDNRSDNIANLSVVGAGHVDTIIVRARYAEGQGGDTEKRLIFQDIAFNVPLIYGVPDGVRNFELGIDRLILVITEFDDDDPNTNDITHPLDHERRLTILDTLKFSIPQRDSPDLREDGRVIVLIENKYAKDIRLEEAHIENEEAALIDVVVSGTRTGILDHNRDIIKIFGPGNFAIVHHSDFMPPNIAPEVTSDSRHFYARKPFVEAGDPMLNISFASSFSDMDSQDTFEYTLHITNNDAGRAEVTDSRLTIDAETGILSGQLRSGANYTVTVTVDDNVDTVSHEFILIATDLYDFTDSRALIGAEDNDTITADDPRINATSDNVFNLRGGEDSLAALSDEGGDYVDTIIMAGRVNASGYFEYSSTGNKVFGSELGNDASPNANHRNFEIGTDRLILVIDSIDDGNNDTDDTDGTVVPLTDEIIHSAIGTSSLRVTIDGTDVKDNRVDITIEDRSNNVTLELKGAVFAQRAEIITNAAGEIITNSDDEIITEHQGIAITNSGGTVVRYANYEAYIFRDNTGISLSGNVLSDANDIYELFGAGNFALLHHSDFLGPNIPPHLNEDFVAEAAIFDYIDGIGHNASFEASVTIDLSMGFGDINGDMLTFTLDSVESIPSNGDPAVSLTINSPDPSSSPNQVSIDASTGVVTITDSVASGTYRVTLTANDNRREGEISDTVDIIINRAPHLTQVGADFQASNREIRLDLNEYFADSDGDPLTLRVLNNNDANNPMVVLPSGNLFGTFNDDIFTISVAELMIIAEDTQISFILEATDSKGAITRMDMVFTRSSSLMSNDPPGVRNPPATDASAFISALGTLRSDATITVSDAELAALFTGITQAELDAAVITNKALFTFEGSVEGVFTVTSAARDGRIMYTISTASSASIGDTGQLTITARDGLAYNDDTASVARTYLFNNSPVVSQEAVLFYHTPPGEAFENDINLARIFIDEDALTYTIISVNDVDVVAANNQNHSFDNITFTGGAIATLASTASLGGETKTYNIVIEASDGRDNSMPARANVVLSVAPPIPLEESESLDAIPGAITLDDTLIGDGKFGNFVYTGGNSGDIKFYIAAGASPMAAAFREVDDTGLSLTTDAGTLSMYETREGMFEWSYIAKLGAHIAVTADDVFTLRTTGSGGIDHTNTDSFTEEVITIEFGDAAAMMVAGETVTLVPNLPMGAEAVVAIVLDSGASREGYKITGSASAGTRQAVLADQAPDIIRGGVHGDTIIAGRGVDEITLAASATIRDTIYYTIDASSDPWIAYDGADTINNFQLGTDKLVFVLRVSEDFTAAGESYFNNNIHFGAGGNVGVSQMTIPDPNDGTNILLTGIKLTFGESGDSFGGIATGNVLTINFATPKDPDDFAVPPSTLGELLAGTGGTGGIDEADNLDIAFTRVAANNAAGVARGSEFIDAIAVARVGVDISVDLTQISDADGLTQAQMDDNSGFSYQWLRLDSVGLGADIASFALTREDAAGATYTPAAADIGDFIRVIVSFRDDVGNSESVSSDAVRIIPAVAVASALDFYESDSAPAPAALDFYESDSAPDNFANGADII